MDARRILDTLARVLDEVRAVATAFKLGYQRGLRPCYSDVEAS